MRAQIPTIIGVCICLLVIITLYFYYQYKKDEMPDEAYTTESEEFIDSYDNAKRYAEVNDYTRAIGYFTEALKIRPDNAEVHNDLGATYLNMGIDVSEPLWPEELSDMTGFEAAQQLAQALAQIESGLIVFTKVRQKIADDLAAQASNENCYAHVERHQLTATVTIIKGKTKEAFRKAEAEFIRAKDLKPRYAPAYQNLGNLWYRMGRHKDALILWQGALELEPNNKELRKYLQANFPEVMHQF